MKSGKQTHKIVGALKREAFKVGLTYEEYLAKKQQGLRRCGKCHEWKEVANFPKDRSRCDGLSRRCHSCIRVKLRKKYTISVEARDALVKRNRENKWSKGIKLSPEHCEKIRQARLAEIKNGTAFLVGETNPNWKGGITPQNHIMRCNSAYKVWRTAVFERDNYTCQHCGDNKGGNLEAHHVHPWKDHKERRYDVGNGLTLCRNCHGAVHDKPDSYRKRRKANRKHL